MEVSVSALGAVIALAVAIILIIKKVHPVYGLIIGALAGGLVGGAGLTGTVDLMINGAKGMMSSILRILTSGVLAGVLIQSGAAVASSVFGPTILELGVSGLATAAMIHASCTVLDSLPHGSFFHTTGGSINMEMKERLKLIPYEAAVGFTMTVVATIVFGLIL